MLSLAKNKGADRAAPSMKNDFVLVFLPAFVLAHERNHDALNF
jgi:hypothetical protein